MVTTMAATATTTARPTRAPATPDRTGTVASPEGGAREGRRFAPPLASLRPDTLGDSRADAEETMLATDASMIILRIEHIVAGVIGVGLLFVVVMLR
jgi:hypothetical protein